MLNSNWRHIIYYYHYNYYLQEETYYCCWEVMIRDLEPTC